MHRAAPSLTTKDYPGQNVNNAEKSSVLKEIDSTHIATGDGKGRPKGRREKPDETIIGQWREVCLSLDGPITRSLSQARTCDLPRKNLSILPLNGCGEKPQPSILTNLGVGWRGGCCVWLVGLVGFGIGSLCAAIVGLEFVM